MFAYSPKALLLNDHEMKASKNDILSMSHGNVIIHCNKITATFKQIEWLSKALQILDGKIDGNLIKKN